MWRRPCRLLARIPVTAAAARPPPQPAAAAARSPDGPTRVAAVGAGSDSKVGQAVHETAPSARVPTQAVFSKQTLNRLDIIGVVHDIQQGFVRDEAVTQFRVTTHQHDPAGFSEDAEAWCSSSSSSSSSNSSSNSSSSSSSDRVDLPASASPPNRRAARLNFQVPYLVKQHFQVRAFGAEFSQQVRSLVSEGAVVRVVGRFKLNRQLEALPGGAKEFSFPYIHLDGSANNGGFLRLISTNRRSGSPAAAPRMSDAASHGSRTSVGTL